MRIENSWAWSNGIWTRLADCRWTWSDLGPVHGVIAVERLRTFGGTPYLVPEHLQRLEASCNQLYIDLESGFRGGPPGESKTWSEQLGVLLQELVERNRVLLDSHEDLGLVLLASPGDPGWDIGRQGEESIPPSLHMHWVSIPWHRFAKWYQYGCRLVTSTIKNIPADCWSPHIKSRSRLHYYLADQQAERLQSGAVALLLDQNDCVTETSISNLLTVSGSTLRSPTLEQILPGISLQMVERLARQLGLGFEYREMGLDEFHQADEVLMVGTTGCIWPAVELDGVPIGNGAAGSCYALLVQAWKEAMGFDFVAQAKRLASTSASP